MRQRQQSRDAVVGWIGIEDSPERHKRRGLQRAKRGVPEEWRFIEQPEDCLVFGCHRMYCVPCEEELQCALRLSTEQLKLALEVRGG